MKIAMRVLKMTKKEEREKQKIQAICLEIKIINYIRRNMNFNISVSPLLRIK